MARVRASRTKSTPHATNRLRGDDASLVASATVVKTDTQRPLEKPPADEDVHTRALIEMLRARLVRDYPSGTMKRDAHPKHHGLARAEFEVEPALPPELAVGLFATPKTHEAWVRFSNASGTPQPDATGDVRGFAMKLFDVPGPKLLPGFEDATTHDLLLITADRFPSRDVEDFRHFVEALLAGGIHLVLYFLSHPMTAYRGLLGRVVLGSVLDTVYTSPTPYLLGDRAVRYRLRPHTRVPAERPHSPVPDYLREELRTRLAGGEVAFDFLVQIQTDPDRMPIEDPTVVWDETLSPYRKVATLRIAEQVPDSPDRMTLAENLSFNPWRCLAEHRPLGGINRARKVIYPDLSALRHDKNGVPIAEPASP